MRSRALAAFRKGPSAAVGRISSAAVSAGRRREHGTRSGRKEDEATVRADFCHVPCGVGKQRWWQHQGLGRGRCEQFLSGAWVDVLQRRKEFPDFVNNTTKEELWVDSWLRTATGKACDLPPGVRSLGCEFRRKSADVWTEAVLRGDGVDGKFGACVDGLDILCEDGRLDEAIQGVELMHRRGLNISEDMLCCILQGCVKHEDFVVGKRVASLISMMGLESSILVGSLVVRLLGLSGDVVESNKVWAAVISENAWCGKAMEMYHKVKGYGVKPNDYVYVAVLKACASTVSLTEGKLIHLDVKESGLQSNVFVGNALINMYSKCGSLDDARRVFDDLSTRDLVSWNTMMAGYARDGQGQCALDLFEQMQQEGMVPDDISFVSILRTCDDEESLLQGQLIHSGVVRCGFDANVTVGRALIDMYSKCGSLEDARQVFDRLPKASVVPWSAMMRAYARHDQGEKAIELFRQMQEEGVQPDKRTVVSILKACTSLGALDQGKLIHACIVKVGYESDALLGSSLIHMYARCGSLEEAVRVFDRLPAQDPVTWNALIAGYAGDGQSHEAIQVFGKMQQQGLHPDEATLVSILKACSSIPALDQGKLVHAQIIQSGLESNLYIGNSLIDMYAKCGSLEDGRRVFDALAVKDLVSWTAMIGAYTHNGNGQEALELFHKMQEHGMSPNKVTFLKLLKACSSTGNLPSGKMLHAHIIRNGFDADLFVGNSLIDMYTKCGSLVDARRVFDRLPTRDRISWNVMIAGYAEYGRSEEALELFERMTCSGVYPNEYTVVSILKACSSVGGIDHGKLIHAQIMERGFELDVFVGSTLVDMYAKCGSLQDARKVFDSLSEKNLVSWNAMLAGYADTGDGDEALRLWRTMEEEGVHLDEVTVISLLKACSSISALDQAKLIHATVLANGLDLNLIVGNALVDLYAKCGAVSDARAVFDRMASKDIVSWTALLKGYLQHGDGQAALELFQGMLQAGLQPDNVTFVTVLKACSSSAALEQGRQVHAHLMKSSSASVSDVFVASSLMDMYAKCGSLTDSQSVFDRLPSRNLVSWNTIIAAYAQHGHGQQALQLFERMLGEGMEPNSVTFVSLLSACSHAGLLEEGRQLFQSMCEQYGIIPDMKHYACMVDLLSRAGHVDEAEGFVDNMPLQPDVVVWMSVLGACRSHGNVELGRRAFESILKLDPTIAAAYILMSNIYDAAGRFDDVMQVQQSMHVAGARKDPGRTWMESDNQVHSFAVDDKDHPDRKHIYDMLKNTSMTLQQ